MFWQADILLSPCCTPYSAGLLTSCVLVIGPRSQNLMRSGMQLFLQGWWTLRSPFRLRRPTCDRLTCWPLMYAPSMLYCCSYAWQGACRPMTAWSELHTTRQPSVCVSQSIPPPVALDSAMSCSQPASWQATHLLAVTCMLSRLRVQARAASELDNHWVHLAPHFAAMQAAIADAKAAAARMCKPLSYDGQVPHLSPASCACMCLPMPRSRIWTRMPIRERQPPVVYATLCVRCVGCDVCKAF